MKDAYETWIKEHCTGSQAGFCRPKSEAMREAFPELILCKGYYSSPADGSRGHWWLKTPDGQIVDPTAAQFLMGRLGSYEEYDPEIHGPLPIGKCMNCGDAVYEENNPPASCMCSEVCARAFDDYLSRS